MRIMPILAAALMALLLARPVRADLVTPDVISVPPEVVVTDQYRGHGLVFESYAVGGEFGPVPFGTHALGGWSWWGLGTFGTAIYQTVNFVVPGTGDPATTDTLRIHVASGPRSKLTVEAFGIDGGLVQSFSMITDEGWVGKWATLQGPGIRSFTAYEVYWEPEGPWMVQFLPGWYMDAIEFQPVAAVPEPGSLALALLGAGGLVARRRWRLRR